jgi:predicted kinase
VAGFLVADETAPPEVRRQARVDAMRHFHLAATYHLPPVLVLLSGLPAAGKSWLAPHLAEPFEARVLRSDVIRKELVGLAPTTRARASYEEGLYSPEHTARTYTELLAQTLETLRTGRSVVVDASFSRRHERERFLDGARRQGVLVVAAQVECSDTVIRQRLADRAHDPTAVSDADLTVYEHARQSFQVPESKELPVARVHSGELAEISVARLLDAMVEATRGSGVT